MPAEILKKSKLDMNVVVNKKMRDYSNEPVFIEKAEKAREVIKKYGLPKFHKKKNG